MKQSQLESIGQPVLKQNPQVFFVCIFPWIPRPVAPFQAAEVRSEPILVLSFGPHKWNIPSPPKNPLSMRP